MKGNGLFIFFAFFFPLCMILGYSYSMCGTWDMLFSVGGLVLLIGSGILLSIILPKLYSYINIRSSAPGTTNAHSTTLNKKDFWISVVIMILCWSPYTIVNLPGNVPFDGMTQLLEHFGRIPHYGHHPVFVTRLYGSIVYIGEKIWCDNFGVFLVIVFQAILCSIIFAKVCSFIYKCSGSKKLWWCSVAFYALFPLFGSYVSAVLKDTFYLGIATLFMLNVCRMVAGLDRNIGSFIISGILVCLTRREGVILVAATGIVLIVCNIKKEGFKSILIAVAVIIAVNAGFNFFVFNICKVQKGEVQEALSVVFQQTARYVVLYPDEVTDEEKEAIDAVLPYDMIADSYNPEISDPIKGKMRSGVSNSDYIKYAITWLKMGLKKPDVYIQATLNNTYGYFYPPYQSGIYQVGIDHSQTAKWETEELNIFYILDRKYENILFSAISFFCQLPVLGYICNAGFYFWLVLAIIVFLIKYRPKEYLAMMVVPVLTYLVCFASPVNGTSRYTLVIYSSVLLVMTVAIYGKKAQDNY